MNALSCGAVVLGSRTSPVMEMIRDGENGLLADFFDVEEFAAHAAARYSVRPRMPGPLGRTAGKIDPRKLRPRCRVAGDDCVL